MSGDITIQGTEVFNKLRVSKVSGVYAVRDDLFGENVPDEFIAAAFRKMGIAKQHRFLIFTKHPERMKKWLGRVGEWSGWFTHDGTPPAGAYLGTGIVVGYEVWPHPNIIFCNSFEDLKAADHPVVINYRIGKKAAAPRTPSKDQSEGGLG